MDTSLLYHVKKKKWEKVGHGRDGIWYPEQDPCTTNYTAVRAVAVDYSGKCGAPALIALVDKIEGPGKRYWIWQEPAQRGRSGGYRLEPRKNGFTMHQAPGHHDARKPASMNLTFVGGSERNVQTNGVLEISTAKLGKAGAGGLRRKLNLKDEAKLPESTELEFGTMVPGADGESFFAVITLQHKDPPEVKHISGKGLNTVVQVGGQRVRFDGVKVVIEDI
jgi:hypothetical protein